MASAEPSPCWALAPVLWHVSTFERDRWRHGRCCPCRTSGPWPSTVAKVRRIASRDALAHLDQSPCGIVEIDGRRAERIGHGGGPGRGVVGDVVTAPSASVTLCTL